MNHARNTTGTSSMTRLIHVLKSALLVSTFTALAACGGGSSSGGGGGGSPSDLVQPLFGGVASIATAGGDSVRLDWRPAVDDVSDASDISYRIYSASTSGGQSFGSPDQSTAGGATSATLTGVGAMTYFVVRAVDAAGNEDENIVELHAAPFPDGSVAFVSDTAGGAGTLGDPADPFPTIQDGVLAVEGNGGGIVLVDASAGGSTYNEEVDLTATVSEIQLFGGFARFSALPGSPDGATILGTRDVEGRETTISGDGLLPFGDDDLVRIANDGSPTTLDGFSFAGTQEVLDAWSGTFYFQHGQTRVTGIGTSFTVENLDDGYLQLDAHGLPVEVNDRTTDTELFLDEPYAGPTGNGSASRVANNVPAVRTVDAAVLLSGCVLAQGSYAESETTDPTVQSALRFVGNSVTGESNYTFRVSGGLQALWFQNNHVSRRGCAISDSETSDDMTYASTSGLSLVFTNNLLDNNRVNNSKSFIDLELEPADALSGGPLDLLVELNEIRKHTSDGVRVDDLADIGANGSVNAVVRHNLFNGASSSGVELNCLGSEAHAGVDISMEFYENELVNGNGDPIESDITVSAGRTTTWIARDNFLSISESETIELDGEYSDTDNVHDGGVMRATILRNVHFSGGEEFSMDLGVAHGGLTTMDWVENTVTGTEEPPLEMETDERFGNTTGTWPFPNGIIRLNAFNNDLTANDDEVIELEDFRDDDDGVEQSICIGWIGHNTCRYGSDPFDGGIQLDYEADNGAFLIERNFSGGGGDGRDDPACELDTDSESLYNLVRVQNNVFSSAGGGALVMDPRGSAAQITNNTSNYSGFPDRMGLTNREGTEYGQLQAHVLNCVATHNGGGDVDWVGGVYPTYTLIRDLVSPPGLGNIGGEPFYAKGLDNLTGLWPFTNDQLADVFTLESSSPAVDAGHPASRHNDPDGSRNDMGAFGGPNAGPMGVMEEGATQPFVYVGVFPAVNLYTGAALVSDTQTLWFGFNAEIDPASVAGAATIRNGGIDVAGTWSVESGFLLKFVPNATLMPSASYFVDVTFGTSLLDVDGTALAYPGHVRFAMDPGTTAESEPNDDGVPGLLAADLTAAQPLGSSPFRISASFSNDEDVDVYSFTVASGERLQASTFSARLGLTDNEEIHLDLYDGTGNRISEGARDLWNEDSEADAGDAYVDHVFQMAGTYYLVVTNPDAGGVQAYELIGQIDE